MTIRYNFSFVSYEQKGASVNMKYHTFFRNINFRTERRE